jgi:hypothetical protein
MHNEITRPAARGVRTAFLGCLCGLLASWLFLTVTTAPLSAARPPATVAVANPNDRSVPRLEVVGPRQLTLPEAWQAAEARAMEMLRDRFQEEGLPVTHMPKMAELRPMLARYWKYKEENEFAKAPVNQTVHWVTLEIPLVPELKGMLLQKEREARMQDRMLWAGRILAGVVVLLVAVAGYFRIEDWTKGYYTTWLRLATVGFIGTCVVALLLFA